MDPKPSFLGQSMTDIVFNNRNKSYGAYFLRRTYKQHLLKAITLAIGLFIFGLYTPKMAGALGLFKGKSQNDSIDTVIYDLQNVEKKTKEVKYQKTKRTQQKRATVKNKEYKVVKEDGEDPPTNDEKRGKESGAETHNGADSGLFTGEGTEPFDPGPTSFTESNEEKKNDGLTTIQQPDFIGGVEAFKKFIQENLIYPEPELSYGDEGETEIVFTLNTDGSLENIKVSKSSGNNHFDKEALRLVGLCNKLFKPRKINGRAVRSVCSTLINFTVED